MTLTRTEKAKQIEQIAEKWKKATAVFFTHYIGLNVGNISLLRRTLKEQQAEMIVAKKTLFRRAAERLPSPIPDEGELPGPIACLFSFGDPVACARMTAAFGKKHPEVTLLGGIFDGKILTKAEALSFANIPSRDVLLGSFASLLHSPLASFALLCSTPLTSFARALQAKAKQ